MELFSVNVNCIPLFYVKSSISYLPETPLKNKNSVDMSRYALRFYVVYYVGEEDSWESLGLKGIKSVHPKGNQLWIFIGRTDAAAEVPILWPLDVKSWLIGKDPDAEKDWRQEEKRVTEDEMVGWHRQLSGHEFEQAPGDSEGQGRVACCSP